MSPSRPTLVLFVVLLTFVGSVCVTLGATPVSAAALDEETWDPIEPLNRTTSDFNGKFDRWLLKPVAKEYDRVMPSVGKQGVGNFFSNLAQPRVAVNSLLQGNFTQSARDGGRFLMNSTVGIFGFIDVAKTVGLEPREEDWGQTFAVWGVGEGPYLVLPVFGPRNARDTVGLGLDLASNPVSYFYPLSSVVGQGLLGAEIVDTRARFLPAEKVLEQAAGDDKYIFVREAYRQRRRSLIYDGNPPKPAFIDDEAESTPPKPETRPATTETPEPQKTGTSASAPPVQEYEPEFKVGDTEAKRPAVGSAYTKISDARKAYKEKKLTKDEYKKVVGRLESAMKNETDQAKRDLKADKLDKIEYKNRIAAIEKEYK
jgi:phospholipid-binding lipoprotein MlaA